MKELEQVLRDAEGRGWRVEGGGDSYFKIYCPCPTMHKKTVHLTPKRNYPKQPETLVATEDMLGD